MRLGRGLLKEADVRTSFARWHAPTVDWCNVARITIDILPDNALLEIFDSYVSGSWMVEVWQTLVHVCRKWRYVVFGSPRRLNLRLHCRTSTPVRETLDVWPLLPIVISDYEGYELWGVDNILAALEHKERIYEFTLFKLPDSQWEKVLPELVRPFPALTGLHLGPMDDETTPIPDSLLGGSAPRLHTLTLDHFPFPGLPNLLLSAPNLFYLDLSNIPDSGYISPESLVTCLSGLTRLYSLGITFESPRSRPNPESRRPHSQTRTLLSNLNWLNFKGGNEYLEDLVARIDAPILPKLTVTFFDQETFDTAQLTQFISRSPKFRAHGEAHVVFSDSGGSVGLPPIFGTLELGISCRDSVLQLSFLAQLCRSTFPHALISAVEHLYVESRYRIRWQDDDIENIQWLDLFRPFTAVKHLYISRDFMPRVAPALQELVGERVIEVLPALQTLLLEETPQPGAIEQFVGARQLAGHPIAVSRWERERDEWDVIGD
jgi:hypothetical protein